MTIRVIMSLYHLSSKVHGRNKDSKKTAVAAAAYRNGERYEGIDGHVSNYKRKKVDGNSLIYPSYVQNKPDAQALWQMADRAELKKDGTVKDSSRSAREFEFSLMTELTPGQNKFLAREFARYISEKYGVACNIAFHHLEGKNPHAHMMYTVRKIESDGTLSEKVRELDKKNVLLDARKKWAELATKHLQQAGIDIVLSEKSFQEQGIKHEPAKHVNADKYHRAKRLGEELPELVHRAEKMGLRQSTDSPTPVEASINDFRGADVYPKYESFIIDDIDEHKPFGSDNVRGISLDAERYVQSISLDMKPEKKAYHTERIRLNTEAPKEESPNNAIDEKSNFIMRYKEKNRIGIRKSAANDIALLALRDYVNQKREELANKKRNAHKYYEQLKVAITETEEKPILFGLFKYQERKYSKGDIDRMREKYNQMKADYLKEDMDFKALCRASGVEVWGNSLDEIEANLDAIKRLTTEHEIKMQLNAMISPSKDVSNPYKAKVTQEVESNISMRYSPSTYTPPNDFNM